jgi:hypothetical protein
MIIRTTRSGRSTTSATGGGNGRSINGRISAKSRLTSSADASVLRKRRSSSAPRGPRHHDRARRRAADLALDDPLEPAALLFLLCLEDIVLEHVRKLFLALDLPERVLTAPLDVAYALLEQFDAAAGVAHVPQRSAGRCVFTPEERRAAELVEPLETSADVLEGVMLPALRCQRFQLAVDHTQILHETVELLARRRVLSEQRV